MYSIFKPQFSAKFGNLQTLVIRLGSFDYDDLITPF